MRTLLTPIVLLAAACTFDRELGTLTESEAATVYTTMTTRLREVHSFVLGSERPPNVYDYGCASGTIELRISLDAELQPQALSHEFASCEVDGLTFDGPVFYRNLDPCEDGSADFAMSVGGRVDIAGSMDGFCFMEVRDRCGILTGHLCGFAAAEIVTGQ